MDREIGLFGGYDWWFRGCGNYPTQVWMSCDDVENVDGEGILG